MDNIIIAVTPHLLNIAGVLLTALIGWAATQASRKWGMDIEAQHREALHQALMTAARLALSKQLTGAAAVELALDYAKRSVPDAIRKLNPPEAVIENLAKSKLEQAAVEAGRAIGSAIKAGR